MNLIFISGNLIIPIGQEKESTFFGSILKRLVFR